MSNRNIYKKVIVSFRGPDGKIHRHRFHGSSDSYIQKNVTDFAHESQYEVISISRASSSNASKVIGNPKANK